MDSDTISEQTVHSKKPTSRRHPVFWFDDGSLVLRVEDVMFKVHGAFLTRQSPFLCSMDRTKLGTVSSRLPDSSASEDYLEIDPARNVSVADLELFFEHLYHDNPLSPDAPFSRIASVVRVSSPGQLDFPRIHQMALRYFANLFPSGPAPFFHPQHLEEALDLATSFNVASIQKGLLYSLVTSTNFDTEGASSSEDNSRSRPSPDDAEKTPITGSTEPLLKSESTSQLATPGSPVCAHKYLLSPRDSQQCMGLMTHFIEHFTPILFTPPATPHMACTDVFADTWMTLVIQPAIDDEGVYKPLETLERIKGVDWGKYGLCSACVVEKIAEWTEEQQTVWRLMDQWLGL